MITLRSQEGKYHSLILFRLSTLQDPGSKDSISDDLCLPGTDEHGLSISSSSNQRQIYVMESSCPHLGADMSHADIEECETGMVAVCPWHRFVVYILAIIRKKALNAKHCTNRYDFDLKTGKSETGLKACTYDVEVRIDPADGVEKVFMQTPKEGRNWRLVELRPVSEGAPS